MREYYRFGNTISLFTAVLLILGSIRYFSGISPMIVFLESSAFLLILLGQAYVIQLVQKYYHSGTLLSYNNLGIISVFTVITSLLLHILFFDFDLRSTRGLIHFATNSLVGFFLLFFIMLLNWMDVKKNEFERLKQIAIDKERESMRFQLKSIEKQWHPHFLFNSLNSISALTVVDPKKARHMIQLLSDFMRNSVQISQNEIIAFEEELKYIRLYCDIEQIRFGERLKMNYNIDPEIESLHIPRLILQPLVENAIKYSLYDSTDQVEIKILGVVQDGQGVISISNPYTPETSYTRKGTGFGIESVKKRLFLIYQRNDMVTIQNDDNQYTITLKFTL